MPTTSYKEFSDPSRQMYIDLDASKEFGFGAHVYHSKVDLLQASSASASQDTSYLTSPDDSTLLPKASISTTVKPSTAAANTTIRKPFIAAVNTAIRKPSAADIPANPSKQKSIQLILFLSRQLTLAEIRYQPIKLEIANIVQIVKKIRYIIEVATNITIIYTNYSATIDIVRQSSINTTSTKKLNLRLIRILEYLQRFRIKIRYKPSKTNIVLDTLSRLVSRSLYRSKESLILNTNSFLVSIILVSEVFRDRVVKSYQNKSRQTRVITIVKLNTKLSNNATKLSYKLVNNLLYFNDSKRGIRLYVSTKTLEYEVFKLAYNKIGYLGYVRTYKKLTRSIYIFNILTKLYKYLRYYSYYQLYQTPRYIPYRSLQLIYTPLRLFYTITIDFILALLKTSLDYDYAILEIDKFSKAITLITGSSS